MAGGVRGGVDTGCTVGKLGVFVWHELWLLWRMWWVGDEGVRVRWWMVRGCGNVRVGVVSGG